MTRPHDLVDVLLKIEETSPDVFDYVDVTGWLTSITWTRGRTRATDEYQPASGVLTLLDTDRTFDPNNSAGPYVTGLVPMRQILIRYDSAFAFFGYITDWTVEYVRGDAAAVVAVEFTDVLGLCGAIDLDETSPVNSGQTSGQRVDTVLTNADLLSLLTAVNTDAGLSTFGATTYGENCLTYLQRCARGEAGFLYAGRDGILNFLDRHTVINTEADFVFSDDRDEADSIPYMRMTQSSSADLLFNKVTGTSETTGNDQVESAPAFIALYFPRVLPLGELLNSTDAEVDDLLQFHLQRFKAPEARLAAIEVNTMSLSTSGTPSPAETVALLDLVTVVDVHRTPLGTGTTIERRCIVDGITHTITPQSWMTTIRFANADTRPFLVLDDAVFGALDSNRLAF